MIDAGQWAKRLKLERSEAVRRDAEVSTGFLVRAETVIREAQLDAARQCLRLAQQAMNDAPRQQRLGMGKVVDAISDLALDIQQRRSPVKGDG